MTSVSFVLILHCTERARVLARREKKIAPARRLRASSLFWFTVVQNKFRFSRLFKLRACLDALRVVSCCGGLHVSAIKKPGLLIDFVRLRFGDVAFFLADTLVASALFLPACISFALEWRSSHFNTCCRARTSAPRPRTSSARCRRDSQGGPVRLRGSRCCGRRRSGWGGAGRG